MHFSFQAFRHRLSTLPPSRGLPHRFCTLGPQQRNSFVGLHAAPHRALQDHSQHKTMAVLQSQEVLATSSTDGHILERKVLLSPESSTSAQTTEGLADQHADLAQKRVLDDSAAANGSPGSSAPQYVLYLIFLTK